MAKGAVGLDQSSPVSAAINFRKCLLLATWPRAHLRLTRTHFFFTHHASNFTCCRLAAFGVTMVNSSRILRMVSASLADAAARMERWMANCSVEIHRASWDTRGGRGARCITTAASWRLCDRAKWVKLEKIQSRWKCVFAFVCSQDQVRQHV